LAANPGYWKVGDFGIAKSLEASDPNLTVLGMIIGTPAYLAPERLAGGPATVASDLYAAGAVLYEALTGRRPIPEGVPLSVLLTATPTPVEELRPDVPPPLARVVMRAMDHDPADRFATAAEMAAALRQPAPAEGLTDTVVVPRAERVTATRLLTQPVFPVAPAGQATRSLAFGQSRRRLTALAGAAGAFIILVIVVVVIVAASASGHHRSTPPPPATTASPAPAAASRPVPARLDAALRRLEREVRP
jgi:serine/threonine-protein kinase